GAAGQQQLKEPIILPEMMDKQFHAKMAQEGLASDSYSVKIDPTLARLQIFDKKSKSIFQMEGLPLKNKENDHLGITLRSETDEYFYGGGTQNGIVNLKGRQIKIENQNSWTEGGVA